jgi:chromosome segregation ATPase
VAKALALKVEQLAPEVVQQPTVEGGAGRGTTFMCDVAERLCWLASELDKLQNANRNYDEALMDSLRAEFNALYEKLRPRIEDCETKFLNLEREVNQIGRNEEETRNQLGLTKGDLAALSQEQRQAAEVLAQHEDLLQYLNGHAQRVEKAVKDVGGLMKHIEGEHLQLASYCNQRLSEHEVLHPPNPKEAATCSPKQAEVQRICTSHICVQHVHEQLEHVATSAKVSAELALANINELRSEVGAHGLPEGRTPWR